NQTSFGDSGGDLRADAAGQRRFMDDYAAPRLGDRGEQPVAVERLQGRDVDDLGADPVALQPGGGGEGFLGHGAPGDERDVGALAQNEAMVERQGRAVILDLL